MREGLFGDERYTLREITGHDLRGMLDEIAEGPPGRERFEDNPPLFFVLAWLSAKLGDPTAWIRLPSVLAGAATVPIVFLLGLRTVGRRAGLAAAAFTALSPFAIFYGNEARAYALLMFFGALSTLVLLMTVERRRAHWWAAYGVTVAALIYTHYTGAVIVAIHAAWTLWCHRDLYRPLLLTYGGVAVTYLPWLPYIDGEPADFGSVAAILGWGYWDAFLQWVAGLPETQPEDMPGVLPLVLLGTGLGTGLVGRAVGLQRLRARKRGAGVPRPSSRQVLVLALAVAAPIACLLYGTRGPDLFSFRGI